MFWMKWITWPLSLATGVLFVVTFFARQCVLTGIPSVIYITGRTIARLHTLHWMPFNVVLSSACDLTVSPHNPYSSALQGNKLIIQKITSIVECKIAQSSFPPTLLTCLPYIFMHQRFLRSPVMCCNPSIGFFFIEESKMGPTCCTFLYFFLHCTGVQFCQNAECDITNKIRMQAA